MRTELLTRADTVPHHCHRTHNLQVFGFQFGYDLKQQWWYYTLIFFWSSVIWAGVCGLSTWKKPATAADPHLSLCIPAMIPPALMSAPPVSYVMPWNDIQCSYGQETALSGVSEHNLPKYYLANHHESLLNRAFSTVHQLDHSGLMARHSWSRNSGILTQLNDTLHKSLMRSRDGVLSSREHRNVAFI